MTSLYLLRVPEVPQEVLSRCPELPSSVSTEYFGHLNLANILPANLFENENHTKHLQRLWKYSGGGTRTGLYKKRSCGYYILLKFKDWPILVWSVFGTYWSCLALKGQRGKHPSLQKSAPWWRGYLPEREKAAAISALCFPIFFVHFVIFSLKMHTHCWTRNWKKDSPSHVQVCSLTSKLHPYSLSCLLSNPVNTKFFFAS